MLSLLVASSLGLATGIFAVVAAMALTGSWIASALIAAVAAGLVAVWVHRSAGPSLDAAACSRGFKIVSGLMTLVGLVLLARLAVFMVDPSQVGCSVVPTSRWEVEHSCLSAYFVAAQVSSSQANIYDDSLYSMPDDKPTEPRKALMLGPFKIDVYEYPPQFLLLPRALRWLTPDFTDLRMLWFALCGGSLLLALFVVARFLGPAAGTRALLLSPVVWVSLPVTLGTLQKGNVQILVIASSMLAMVLFERRQPAAGGAILAFMTVSKLYPGLLIMYLLARRQWRAVAWTTAFAGAFSLLTLLILGWGPYAAFLDHLPGLMSGEAFPAFRNPAPTASNLSIPGLVFKLKLFGGAALSFGAAKLLGWGYTLVALAVTVFAGSRTLRDDEKPQTWMAILILATLRSPFLPQTYGVYPPVWLLTLLAATLAPLRRAPFMILCAWIALNLYWPSDWPMDPRVRAIASTVALVVTLLLVVLALRRRQVQPGTPW
ncbi:MAG TPA: glycosyltransferase family 87 protein [Patescibacteria group bacterium]|nr:glycosyltransferase family 87 protein [Patescibacteria group bacterium]